MCTINTIEKKVKALKALRAQREELDAEIEKLEQWVKDEMVKQDTYEFSGNGWKVSWNTVVSNRFDQSAFKEAHPDLFESYKKLSESRRFSLK